MAGERGERERETGGGGRGPNAGAAGLGPSSTCNGFFPVATELMTLGEMTREIRAYFIDIIMAVEPSLMECNHFGIIRL
jgi:hypothetical protein